MRQTLQRFLADESRALQILVNAAVTAMALGLAVAVAAIVLMS